MHNIDKYLGEAKFEGKTFELKRMDMDDVMMDRAIHNLKTVATGTMDDLWAYAKKNNLIFRNAPKQMFGGYWYDKKTGIAYLPDVK